MRTALLALAAAALLGMLLTRGPAASSWSVRGQHLLRDGRVVLTCQESGWLDVLWQLGWPEAQGSGEDFGQCWSRYDYPRLGLRVWMGELWEVTSVDVVTRR